MDCRFTEWRLHEVIILSLPRVCPVNTKSVYSVDSSRGRFSGLLREAVLGPSRRTGLQPVEFGDRLQTCPTNQGERIEALRKMTANREQRDRRDSETFTRYLAASDSVLPCEKLVQTCRWAASSAGSTDALGRARGSFRVWGQEERQPRLTNFLGFRRR